MQEHTPESTPRGTSPPQNAHFTTVSNQLPTPRRNHEVKNLHFTTVLSIRHARNADFDFKASLHTLPPTAEATTHSCRQEFFHSMLLSFQVDWLAGHSWQQH